jgi:TfoX/Sxy family transcriptional regulator of competence genes
MPWVKVPAENHPKFHAALPNDARVETMKMFGGVAAKVNGHIFAGLFGLSTMVLLDESDRKEALALKGAAMFDPMGDGRVRSDKVMLPERMMDSPAELRTWIARAFRAAAKLPEKKAKAAAGRKASTRSTNPKKRSAGSKRSSKG